MHVLDSGKTGNLVYLRFWGKLNKEFSSFFPNFCHGIKSAPRLSALLKNQQILAKKMKKKKDLLDVPCTHYSFADSECTYIIWTKTKIGFRVRHFTTTCLLFKNPIITFRRSTIYYYQSLFYMFFTTYIFRTLNLFFETVKFSNLDIFKKTVIFGKPPDYIYIHKVFYIFLTFSSLYGLLYIEKCPLYYLLKVTYFKKRI